MAFSAKCMAKYLASNTSGNKGMVSYNKIRATENWVECSLDIMDMQKALMATHNINEKYRLMEALEKAEKRKQYMYRHNNFNSHRAGIILSAVINAQ
jgi:hypothetical protein